MSSVHTSLKLNWLIELSEVLSSELCLIKQMFISLQSILALQTNIIVSILGII